MKDFQGIRSLSFREVSEDGCIGLKALSEWEGCGSWGWDVVHACRSVVVMESSEKGREHEDGAAPRGPCAHRRERSAGGGLLGQGVEGKPRGSWTESSGVRGET